MRSPRMAVADTQLRALTCLLSRGCYHEKCGHQRPSLFLCSSDKEFPPQLCGSSYAGEIQVTAEDKMEWEWPKGWQIVVLATYCAWGMALADDGMLRLLCPSVGFQWDVSVTADISSWPFIWDSWLCWSEVKTLLLPVTNMEVLEHLGAHLGCFQWTWPKEWNGGTSSPSNKNEGKEPSGVRHFGDVTKDLQVFPRFYFDIPSPPASS